MQDISDERGYPYGMLDPSAPVRFEIDGVRCASLQGFLECLKFDKVADQKNISKYVGKSAIKRGQNKDNPGNQKADRILYWQGESFKRNGKEFDDLMHRVFREMAQNANYQKALLLTEKHDLSHSKGKSFKKDTLLTKNELTKYLKDLRTELMEGFKTGF